MTKSIRIVLPCPSPDKGQIWGDWYFARSLADSMEQLGIIVRFDFTVRGKINHWLKAFQAKSEIDLVIRGRRPFEPVKGRPYFLWVISHPDTVSDEELSSAEHVFVASKPFADHLSTRGFSCSFLPQCTDPRIFEPNKKKPSLACDVLFVGNRRRIAPREVVDLAMKASLDLQVWGSGWDDILSPQIWRGASIPNADLGAYYASANIVLNDHTANMLAYNFASNRVYDVMACGTALLTEKMDGLPDIVQAYGHQYTADTFLDAISRARSVSPNDLKEASRLVLAHHTFDNRAKAILNVIDG